MAETDRKEKLKSLLGITGDEKDVLVGFAIENAEETVKNYCHIEEVPEGLSNTVIRMAMDIYRKEQPGESETPLAVKSISEGDTSTSFGTPETGGYAESVLKDYKIQLNRYRRVVFR